MSSLKMIKKIKDRFPELNKFPRAKLKLIEKALVYASELSARKDLVTPDEHEIFMKTLPGYGEDPRAGRIKAYRLRQDLTQAQLAKKSGITQANISAMERGRRSIGLNVAKKLASILNCDYKKLI
jgi:DNA-binding XRE family transcriptional regulator